MVDFYGTLGQVSVTMFGLWLVVVQLRRREWISAGKRWGAQAAAMHFALPGVMSLLSMAAPDSALLWRISFWVFAVTGAAGVVLLDRGGRGAIVRVRRWTAVALYAAVALVAALPGTAARAFGVAPLEVTAVLLSLLLLYGLHFSLSLLFEAPTGNADHDPG